MTEGSPIESTLSLDYNKIEDTRTEVIRSMKSCTHLVYVFGPKNFGGRGVLEMKGYRLKERVLQQTGL